ncbi:MAG: prepilin peptidase [Clostridiales bacterium]|nr:prepilin peptidase [Clostridiales bacterium]
MQIRNGKDDVKRPVLWAAVILSTTAVLLTLMFVRKADPVDSLKILSLYGILIPVAFIDYKHHIIPNRYVLICAAIALVFGIYEVAAGMDELADKAADMIIGLLFGGSVFGLGSLMSKGGVGMGDVKLFAALGLALGFQMTFSLVLYTLICSAVAGALLIAAKRATSKTRLAMGPYILAGMILLIILG